jgi:branched-chain amino acid transport system substrate-binding protein
MRRLALLAVLAALPAPAAEPIKSGLSTPLTGTAANLGQQDRYGAEFAVAELNAAGGVLGRPLALIAQDNRCNPAEAVKAAGRLIDEDKVSALLGAMCSSATLATMPVVLRAKLPFVVAISTAEAITKQAGSGGNGWTFKLNPTDAGLAHALVGFLGERGVKRIAVLAEDTDYGRGGVAAMTEAAKPVGVEIVLADFFQQGTQDFTTVLTKYRAQKPQAIALYALGADHMNYFRQYVTAGLAIPMTGRVNMSEVQKTYLGSGAVDGTTSVFPYDPNVENPANQAFVASFKAKHGTEPFYQSFYSYEATKLLADAIARAGSTDAEPLRQAIQSTDYRSMLGESYSFDDHNQAHNNAVITEVKAGKVHVVALRKVD